MSATNSKKAIDIFKIAIWFLAIPAFAAIWFTVPDELWQYLFYLRVPILAGLFLILFPLIALFPLQALLRNLFVLGGKWQLAFTIVGSTVAGMAVTIVTIVILCNASSRFNMTTKIIIPEIWQYILAIVLCLPICITAILLSREELEIKQLSKKWFKTWIGTGTLIGAFCSGIILVVAYFIRRILVQSLDINSTFKLLLISFIETITKHDTVGYLDKQEIFPTHIIGIAFFTTGLIAYIVIFFIFQPRQKTKYETPTLLYLTIIISNYTLVCGGATFYLDYYHIPLLIPFLLVSFLSFLVFDTDHFFNLETDRYKGEKTDIIAALKERLKHQDLDNHSLIIVCASGGGIQAAGWTTIVLTGLQTSLGKKFTKAIGLISSVSGGSVGTVYYLDRFSNQGFPPPSELDNIFYASTADGLDAIGWGLAYPDLWRITPYVFLPKYLANKPFLQQEISDRGLALEIDWKGKMRKPNTTLGQWRKQINTGEIPIPIFNTTLVEDGRRFLISPMTFPKNLEQEKFPKHIDFNTLYSDWDINVVTAARLSATFPFVSPICRNKQDNDQGNYHMADGGYFDNSGIVTVVEWLDESLKSLIEEIKIKNILLIQINAFPEDEILNENQGNKGWFMATIGPLLAMYKVRDTTQISRTSTAIRLLKEKWVGKVNIQHVPIFFPSSCNLKQPPLSWKLTKRQKQDIKDAWEQAKSRVVEELKDKCKGWGVIE